MRLLSQNYSMNTEYINRLLYRIIQKIFSEDIQQIIPTQNTIMEYLLRNLQIFAKNIIHLMKINQIIHRITIKYSVNISKFIYLSLSSYQSQANICKQFANMFAEYFLYNQFMYNHTFTEFSVRIIWRIYSLKIFHIISLCIIIHSLHFLLELFGEYVR